MNLFFIWQELHFKYLKLEKLTVSLKYTNAKLQTELDEFKRVRDVRSIDLNGMEESLFDNEGSINGDDELLEELEVDLHLDPISFNFHSFFCMSNAESDRARCL